MTEGEGRRNAITLRSIAIGIALIPITIMWVIQAEIVWYSGEPTTISLFYHVVFILFALTVANLGVRKLWPRIALTSSELLTIYVMLCMASVVAGHDMLEILVSLICHPFWFATPENKWAQTFLGDLPRWLVVSDKDILSGAFEGGSTAYRWDVIRTWAPPLLWWASFLFSIVMILLLINIILRKQWTENERLSYPVIQIPLEITTRPTWLFGNKLFWIGFAIAATIDIINGLNKIYPSLPAIPIVHAANLGKYFTEKPWNAIGTTWVSLYPFAIGLCFFLPTDMAFSCWFFFLFWKMELVLTSALGVRNIPGFPFITEQSSGAYIGFALMALWVSRKYLVQVGRRILGLSSDVPDDDEPVTYRTAALLIALLLGYLFLFCHAMHMSWWVIALMFVIYFTIAIAIARMRAELGPPAHDLHYGGPDQILVKSFGKDILGKANMIGLSFMWFYNRAYRGHPMPYELEGLKIAERQKLSSSRMAVAIVISAALGIFAAYWALLHCFYKYGINSGLIGPAYIFGSEPWSHLQAWLTDPKFAKPNNYTTIATLVGIGMVGFLAFMRMVFIRWPFHPVGLAVSSSWSMGQLWFPIFLSWLIKALLLRYGGSRAYRPAIPFFVGLVLGEFVVGSFWNAVGIMVGIDTYHFWPY